MVLTLLVNGPSQGQPATDQDVLAWRNQFMETMIYDLNDPMTVFVSGSTGGPGGGAVGLPVNTLVDPRTMKILSNVQGYGGMDPAVDQLALKNKK